MTPEEFETGLYAILGEGLDPIDMEKFKAKGDEAYVFVDLCSIADIEPQDYENELLDFMYEAGVPEFPGLNRRKGFELWPDRESEISRFHNSRIKAGFCEQGLGRRYIYFQQIVFFRQASEIITASGSYCDSHHYWHTRIDAFSHL